MLFSSSRRGALTVLAAFAAVALSGCGFHLRGEATFPFRTLYVQGAEGSPLYAELQRALRSGGNAKLLPKIEGAEAVLQIISNQNDKEILTLSSGGKVREYMLTQRIVFRVHDNKGAEWISTAEIRIKRDFSYNDSQALAKEAEEQLLLQDMQTDAVQQLMRRLATATTLTPVL